MHEANKLSIATAARDKKADQDENTAYRMKRVADNILIESYLNRLIAQQFTRQYPDGFPTDEMVVEYFEKNRDRFVIEERVHVWQIFLQANNTATDSELVSRAESIIRDIKSGKMDFASAAIRYSEHGASSTNGGYMGLVKMSELLPGIREPLMALPEEGLSGPIQTENGVHILKHGGVIPKQVVELEQVRPQIGDLLRQQAVAQLRQAIYVQASEVYPVETDDSKIEEWRLRLRTNTE